MTSNRSSGLDFSDKAPEVDDPEVAIVAVDGPEHLWRNKPERRRIQGFMKTQSLEQPSQNGQSRTLASRIDHWLVNDGGKQLFMVVWILLQVLVAIFGFATYQLKDNLVNARALFGTTYAIARMAALLLHVNVALILLPVCRNFISFLRRTPLNQIIPFDQGITFHKVIGWFISFWTIVHIIAHMVNFARLAAAEPGSSPVVAFLRANFTTGPGVTGWLMTLLLAIMIFFAREKQRRAHFERFWYSHHLFLPFFVCWQLHGMFCMIKPDRPPYCSSATVGVFWKYWLVGGVIFVYERILREIRSRHRTYISKVIQHPSNVVEIQIKKEKIITRAGQYIFLSCPDISYFQWHPFTLTSAPEEDYLSVHIRVVGDFTGALARAVGCDFHTGTSESKDSVDEMSKAISSSLNKVLPRVMIDGPFGSASEDYLKYETILLVGAGIGVAPFASILKSIWYRMNNFSNGKRTRLSKVYFIWVIRDLVAAEWFHSLLQALEEQDAQNRIEISIYLTSPLKEDDVNNIMVQDVGADKDTITSLRAPTLFGRPNWDRVFSTLSSQHSHTDIGVFFCGPHSLSKILHLKCNQYTNPKSTRFIFGKENF